jgi:hypothetical protein
VVATALVVAAVTERKTTPAGQPREGTVIEALAAVMEAIRAVGKGDRNPEFGYMFRGVDAVVNTVGPVLRQHGVIVMPVGGEVNYRDVQTSKGKPSRECTVKWRYRWYGPQGDFIDTEVPGESMDQGDKGTPKAMSVAYRTLLIQALCIPTGDRDPDADSYERANEPDPREPLWADLKTEREKLGWSREDMMADFASMFDDKKLADATAAQLQAYLEKLRAPS